LTLKTDKRAVGKADISRPDPIIFIAVAGTAGSESGLSFSLQAAKLFIT
jgi:hypothetical protein